MRAYIVVDLGFGDAGKGLLTDFLVRHLNAGLVVRYNGGAQAGHNVIAPDGRHHTFSQFGSGTFIPGVKTFLSRHVVIHPGALLMEGEILERKGVRDAFSRLRMSERALIITPFHQAANRIREIMRGENRHGSCGVGVGEAVEDSLTHPEDRILAGDFYNPPLLRRKLRKVREEKREQLAELGRNKRMGESLAREWMIFEKEDVIGLWMSSVARIVELGLVAPDSVLQDWMHQVETLIFEGAQGILLDAEAGFHPFTTWSNCTAANAYELIQSMAPDSQVFQIGVMRSYAVRHGPGPFPTETDVLGTIVSEHNQYNVWQGKVRYGWFDAVLSRYALNVTGKIDALVVTHMDVLSRLETWKYSAGYKGLSGLNDKYVSFNKLNGVVESICLPNDLPLPQRMQFTQTLSMSTPVLDTCDVDDRLVIEKIESMVGQPVGVVSYGARAENVNVLSSIPS